jgi:branched-chain amino acid aminotransferase
LGYPIIDEIAGSQLMAQGKLVRPETPEAEPLFQPTDNLMFYEVIRVTRSIPLFWEDHMERLAASVGGRLPIPENLLGDSRTLIAANGLAESNLRIVLSQGQSVIHQIPSYYPAPEVRRAGVPVGIIRWEREDPNTKIVHPDYKAAVAARFAQTGPFGRYFELLLAGSGGFLTEGSRSNLFFIRRDDVLSAPDRLILKGITRKYVQQAIVMAGLHLREEMLTEDDVRRGGCEAAFLTGSPIDVLPVSSIEDLKLPSGGNPAMLRIIAAYGRILDEYIRTHLQSGT